MGANIIVFCDFPNYANHVIWDILDYMHPDHDFFQNYTKMVYEHQKFSESSLKNYPDDFKIRLKFDFYDGLWINKNNEYVEHSSREEAEKEPFIARAALYSGFFNFFIEGNPNNYAIARFFFGMPTDFMCYHEVRKLHRNIVHEFAKFTKSSFAIYYPEFDTLNKVDALYTNEFNKDYALGEGRNPLDFKEEVKKIAPPLDWDKDYFTGEDETPWVPNSTLYFYEDLNL